MANVLCNKMGRFVASGLRPRSWDQTPKLDEKDPFCNNASKALLHTWGVHNGHPIHRKKT